MKFKDSLNFSVLYEVGVLIIILLLGSQLVSCAAGNMTADEQQQAGPAAITKKGAGPTVVDVTNYYVRPEIQSSRPGNSLATFESDNFIGSAKCAVCHEKLTDKKGNDMSISGHWRSTMMANAAKDPLWQAKVESEVHRNPALKEVIESKCATCHMPMAWTQEYSQGKDGLMLEEGLLNPGNQLHEAAMDGVSCSLCHQIQDKNLGQKKSFSGKFVIDTKAKSPDRKIFGPYKDPFVKTMQTSVGYIPEFGPQTNDSALCATCHTLYTPFVDAQGNVAGEFPEQTPYLEWKHSDYGVNAERRYDIGENPGQGKICQECHMPHSEVKDVIIAKWTPSQVKPKEHFSQHHFVGGNVFMLNILQDNIASLGLSASSEKFEDTKERTMKLLQTETAELSIEGLQRQGKELLVLVKLRNKVGHKYPTGIPTRRTWIHFVAKDAGGQVVFESGRPLADGRIEGNNSDMDIMSYEPHYELINKPDQVQIYEGIMMNTDNQVTYTLLRAAKYAKDNRLLPDGFDKATASSDVAVFGNAAADANFAGGSDQVMYQIDTSSAGSPITITVRLLYSPVSYSFVKDLEKDGNLPLVKRFLNYYQYADKMPQEVSAIQTVVQ
jgi:hypothetical protein